MRHPVRLELTNNGQLIQLANYYIACGALLFTKLSLGVTQGKKYGAPSDNRTY